MTARQHAGVLIRGPLADTVISQEETVDLFKSPLGSTVESNRECEDVGARRMERWEKKGQLSNHQRKVGTNSDVVVALRN